MKPLVEAVVSMAKEIRTRMNMASGSATRKNVMEEIIKAKTVITLETVFKRGEISGCYIACARNVGGIIPTPQGFMLSVSLIQGNIVWGRRHSRSLDNQHNPDISELVQHHQV